MTTPPLSKTTVPTNYLDIMKFLPGTNCRQCDRPTCMVFAVEVIQGKQNLGNCPHVEQAIIGEIQGALKPVKPVSDYSEDLLNGLKEQVKKVALAASEERLGGKFKDGRMAIPCLGKDFFIDQNGEMASQCHVNSWVLGPLLNYAIHCKGKERVGRWVPLRELPGGLDWGPLFGRRCEKPFKQVIDNYYELFEDLVDIFGGKPADKLFDSDIAIEIRPLPRLPILVCYWKEEDGMEANLNLFFDAGAEDNLIIDSIYTLGVGMLTMFEKIALTHGK